MRVLVVDDEPLARENLIRMLAEYPDVEVAGEASNGIEAVERITESSPDAVFLDIEMPGLDGFEVLSSLSRAPRVVFATAFDEYAIRAFEANAVDYLLKPIQTERVGKAVAKLRDVLGRGTENPNDAVRRLLSELRPSGPRKIAVRQANRIVLVSPREIAHISAEEKLVFVHTPKEKFLIDKTVTEMEECLERAGFFRINRGDLVNLEFVRELMPWFSGGLSVKFSTVT
jgi:two-component system LytT family response regulator